MRMRKTSARRFSECFGRSLWLRLVDTSILSEPVSLGQSPSCNSWDSSSRQSPRLTTSCGSLGRNSDDPLLFILSFNKSFIFNRQTTFLIRIFFLQWHLFQFPTTTSISVELQLYISAKMNLKSLLLKLNNYKVLCVLLFIYLNRIDRFAVIYYENYGDTDEIVSNLLHKTVNFSQTRNAGVLCVS
jgi:hypothetical protein